MNKKQSDLITARYNLAEKLVNGGDNPILLRLREYYEKNKKVGSENCDIIFRKSKEIVEKTVENLRLKNSVGMLFGKVQSGKTLNYTSYIVHAFLNNIFDIAIILTATNNDLYEQNRNRIKEVVEYLDSKFIRFEEITRIVYDFHTIIQTIEDSRKFIICSLKEIKNLKKISEWIKNYQWQEGNGCPRVIIIDDEGDQASLNNIKEKIDKHAKGEKINKKRSPVNEQIINLKTRLNAFFLSVTATPYANMLLDTKDPLSPDFIEKIVPGNSHDGKRYLGISDVWDGLHSKIIRGIQENEVSDLVKKNSIPQSLKKAISSFLFVSQALGRNFRMWVHTHVVTSNHRIVTKKIKEFIQELRTSSEDKLIEFINLGFWEIENKKLEHFDEDYKEKILKKMGRLINLLATQTINSKNDAQRWRGGDPLVNEIVIGSKLLDRGVTIDYLTTAYITIRGKSANADTTLQRARWFGYKKEKSIKYLRVWCTNQIDNDYLKIKQMEDLFHENIDLIKSEGRNLKDWGSGEDGRTFLFGDESLWMTRRTIKQVKNKFINLTQYRVKDDYEKEWEFFEETKSNFQNAENIYGRPLKEKEFDSLVEFEKYIISKHEKVVIEQILSKCDISKTHWEILKKDKKKLKVILIVTKTERERYREIIDQKEKIINNPFGGWGKNKEKRGYKGDRYLHQYEENKGKFLLKIWTFELFLDKSKEIKYESSSSYKKTSFIFYSLSLPETIWTITNKEKEKTEEEIN
ncbi:MAG: hypothetical protein I3270_01500 [Candidatus Moeniiplasma glomeromycotorum]|nr:hypothetical protein [Candidatus Moeniiplasma glomeromycotorum]MCE8162382.1 hypothetical protein [Candidatus Moeniiplasma glomeromycotorum]MCE8166307.1 hypothetical protein [Candidatus Moeniiplasma glomeromycotorum]MCE8166789.1 hypothetical protein [Candidatus Moeniiplasma glomeromycotorum]